MGKRNENTVRYKLKYNKNHYVRVPLDLKVPEYNALKEYCSEQGIGINTFIRNFVNEVVPADIMEKHKNDVEKD